MVPLPLWVYTYMYVYLPQTQCHFQAGFCGLVGILFEPLQR